MNTGFQILELKQLVKADWNYKQDNDILLSKLIENIKRNGQIENIIVRELQTGFYEVVNGNHRYDALKKLNINDVYVYNLGTISLSQAQRIAIETNETRFATDELKLDSLIKDLLETFTPEELELTLPYDNDFFSEFNVDGVDEDKDADVIPEVDEEIEPITKTGDIWLLGKHRVMCGDSTKADDVARLMNGEKADMVFTDPPYGVSYEKKTKDIFKNTRYTAIANDDLKADDFAYFINDVFINVCAFLKDSGSYYIFSCQGGDQEMMMMMMRQNNIKCRHQLIWVKDSPVFSMGRLDYDYKHEPILYGWKKNHVFYRNGNQDKSVWQFKRTENKLHPTMKPVELIENAILNSTEKDMLVVDYFLGSGSTLIACEKTKRVCYGMEISPKYCDVIVKRYEDFTGKKAVLEG